MIIFICILLGAAVGFGVSYSIFHNSGYDDGFEAGQKESVKQAEMLGYLRGIRAVRDRFDTAVGEELDENPDII